MCQNLLTEILLFEHEFRNKNFDQLRIFGGGIYILFAFSTIMETER